MKKVIITGATGAIGTALIDKLVENNVEVMVIVRENSSRIKNIKKDKSVKIVYSDLSHIKDIKNYDNEVYDTFYHFAWDGTFGKYRDDKILQEKNVEFAVDCVNMAKEFNCKMFIGAGSQAEYGIKNEKLKPDTVENPITEYGKAKLKASLETRKIANELNINHIWVRILSIYGENDGVNSMVMSTINKLLNNETPIFTKAEQIWDYLYSRDAAEAFYLMGNSNYNNKIYVLGSGDERVLKEYIEDIKNVVNDKIKIKYGDIPYNENQLMYLSADTTELKKDFKWSKKTEFIQGIKNILEYEHKKNKI